MFPFIKYYPARGILYHAHPKAWELWRNEKEDLDYRFICSFPSKPTSSKITSALSADKYARQKERLETAQADGTLITLDSLVTLPMVVAAGCIGLGAAWVQFGGLR